MPDYLCFKDSESIYSRGGTRGSVQSHDMAMKVLGLQNSGVSKRLEEYTEEEILQAFQKTSETLSWYIYI